MASYSCFHAEMSIDEVNRKKANIYMLGATQSSLNIIKSWSHVV